MRASKARCLAIMCMAITVLLTGCETKEEREAREARELAEQSCESYYQTKEDYDDLMRTLDEIKKRGKLQMNNIQKITKIIALVLGIAMVISGVVFLSMSGNHTGHSGGLSRASTSIEFGGDFYTTSAQCTGLAANAVTDLYDIVKTAIGIFFIFIGGTDCCMTVLFWKKFDSSANEYSEKSNSDVEAVSVIEESTAKEDSTST